MKAIISLLICITTMTTIAQTPYTSTQDVKHPEVKILKGIISKYALINDTSFQWYGPNRNAYQPDTAVVSALRDTSGNYSYVLFGGTWCEDTQFILPKFFHLQEVAGVPDDHITFFAVDRSKQTLGNIAAAFHITNVPTIIVMKNGQEVGRVVEYGKTGQWDKELAGLLK